MSQMSQIPDFGQRAASNRSQRGLSQNWVARHAGLDPSYLSRIENGKVQPSVSTAQKVAAALGTSLGELLGSVPSQRKHQRCPVSQSGACLVDLIYPHWEARAGKAVEKYTPRQIRMMRRVAALMREGSPELLKSLDGVVRGLLEPGKRKERKRR
ncbi:MAG: helix-turn-helix transcriptional regulator [Myxococcales bacterium]|nr:helix-turn-helix transcriptional regulator [Myxococcales bacterium]